MSSSVVEVFWRDAFFEHDEPSPTDRPDYVVRTVGYRVDGPRRFLTVAGEILPGGDGRRAVTHVPVSGLLRLVLLRP